MIRILAQADFGGGEKCRDRRVENKHASSIAPRRVRCPCNFRPTSEPERRRKGLAGWQDISQETAPDAFLAARF